MLKSLGHLPEDTRGILSNCACLGEGVDVPVLDGVAFIDPKRSMVDIIQAVGRVIRKAAGKQLGTIVIPVFIDESEDADHEMESRQFYFGACGTGRETYGAVTPSSRFTSLVVLPRVSWIRVTNGSPL